MMLLGIHVIFITLLVVVVGAFAYRMGVTRGERQVLRRLRREEASVSEPEG
ncbi:MAG: hypothetical protein O7E56_05345 [SAR324 cluster bacterium]|nr:hypothetical protein [SAR324 cluster bacterium]MCZ6556343.1 hypothetical protein [SAR324 cluster bacterium]MCZ6627640.1 hypothetical protein [SAR324 cluster bacterium]MCZ6645400.1 hypothetical protein [SAR324 cluster bacterium]MCZ6728466.1 hypothetical protein [SAR324 cluster bacterium]